MGWHHGNEFRGDSRWPDGRIQRVRGREHHGVGPQVARLYAIWILLVQTVALTTAAFTP
jgi:hypothetical protein